MTEEKKPTEEVKQEVLTVDKEKFNTLIEEFKSQKETIDKLKEDLDRVEYASDKARLSVYDSRSSKKSVPRCRIRTMEKIEGESTNQYIIKGWRMIEDIVEEQANGIFLVKQTVELVYEDKDGKVTKEQMPYRVFEKKFKYIDADIVSETKDTELGTEIVELRLMDGRKIKMDIVFIN